MKCWWLLCKFLRQNVSAFDANFKVAGYFTYEVMTRFLCIGSFIFGIIYECGISDLVRSLICLLNRSLLYCFCIFAITSFLLDTLVRFSKFGHIKN